MCFFSPLSFLFFFSSGSGEVVGNDLFGQTTKKREKTLRQTIKKINKDILDPGEKKVDI